MQSEVARARQTIVIDGRRDFYLGTPILIGETVYGVIGFWSGDTSRCTRPHPQAREVIEMMAKSIAAAVHQRQLTDQLAYQANHDALTGLPNRLMLQHELDSALQDAAITGEPAGCVVHRSGSVQADQRYAGTRSRRHRAAADIPKAAGSNAAR